MRDEGGMMRDERRRTRDDKALKHASIVQVSVASDRPSSFVLVLLALSMLLSSCGYRFTPVGGIVPEDARTIAILAFVNSTNEPYVDVEVTKAVVDEFLADGRLKVISSEAADLVLKGSVTKFDLTPSSYTTDNYVQSYTVSISVNVTVEDVKTHKIIWQEKGLGSVFVSSYSVTLGDITGTKIAKETALKTASRDVASTLRSRLLEGF
jgi:curli biogenesis system outer membrane secretion channel CsgG